ncbi:MAG: gamma-glutamyltransferase [Planctomycetota bacterium]|jgi:gamma-glutamyltranspeptidase
MFASILTLFIFTVQAPDTNAVLQAAVRSPTFSPTGRLAVEINGNLWMAERMVPDGGSLVPVTSGPEWDRQPSWTPDGTTLVFSSDRGGRFDLWMIVVGANGEADEPKRLTDSPEPDVEPDVGPDGEIVFVRGRNATANLWVRSADGGLRQLTTERGAERSPTFSPDGQQIVYVSERSGRRQLRLRAVDNQNQDNVIIPDMPVEFPSWSPDGQLIAFTTRGGRHGVWVTPVDGSYTNLVTGRRAAAAWSPDGQHLALAELPRSGPGYNGNPNRVADREAGDVLPSEGRLWIVRAPTALDTELREVAVKATGSRAAYNEEAFDRVWSRIGGMYLGDHATEWEALRSELRPSASVATSDAELEAVIHQLVSRRPRIQQERQGKAGISSAHPLATAAGIEVLKKGGNVVDAAVAVSFALGVVEPDASGIGGYGQMVLYLQHMEEPVAIEFLTRVPEQATLSNASLLENGELPRDGPVLANVPGTVAGMWTAWERYGSGNVQWADLIEPAIQLADGGFVLDDAFTTTLSLERDRFLKYESSTQLFFPGGQPLQAGDTLRNPDLAWTLRQIADGGANAFYRGDLANRIVRDLRGRGNAITLTDMDRYFSVEREPVRGTYRGHTVYGSAPATSGGARLVAKLNLLEQWQRPNPYTEDGATLHAMIEAWKLAPSRGRLADPSLWPVDLEPVLDKGVARNRWTQCFDPDRSTGPADLQTGANGEAVCVTDELAMIWGEDLFDCDLSDNQLACPANGTTAFTIADAAGNMLAVTQTLGTWGGNFYVTPGLGFLYNDKLRSYGTNPMDYGARLPYARNTTGISPTLIFKGTDEDRRPLAAVGAAGNAWIAAAVYQAVTGIVDYDLGPQDALELPRFLVAAGRQPGRRNGPADVVVQVEDGFSPLVMQQLRELGHQVQKISLRGELRMGYGAAVIVADGQVSAGADPRRSGAAGVIDP